MNLLPEDCRTKFLENFTDTLIYEHVGGYLLKSLVTIYKAEEVSFVKKCAAIYEISRTDPAHFNRKFQCNFAANMVPQRSHKVLKVLWRCQLPYEMFFTLHETV